MLKPFVATAVFTSLFITTGCASLYNSNPQTTNKCTQLKREWVFNEHHPRSGSVQMNAERRDELKKRLAEAHCK